MQVKLPLFFLVLYNSAIALFPPSLVEYFSGGFYKKTTCFFLSCFQTSSSSCALLFLPCAVQNPECELCPGERGASLGYFNFHSCTLRSLCKPRLFGL